MSKQISIAVGANEVWALWVQSGTLRWHAQSALSNARGVDDALRTLLASAPPALSRARATVVLSPRWVQTKQLNGLPAVGPPRVVAQLLRENEQAFFLWSGRRSTVVTHRRADGTVYGAAFDAECLDAVLRAVRAARLRVLQIAPSVAAIAAALPDQTFVWSDGEQSFELNATRDGFARIRRTPERQSSEPAPIPDLLRPIGEEAGQFLPAYAAAVARGRLPLAWRPREEPGRSRARANVATAAACAALLVSTGAAAIAPGLRAASSRHASERELRRLQVDQQHLAATQSELRRVSDALDGSGRSIFGRGRITRTFGALSAAIPESTAILDIRFDSVEGTFSAIAPNVADVLPALADVGEIVAPQIVGSVTRETIAGVRLERAAFRFRRPRSTKGHPR